jgi:hypothetical protein
MDDSHESAYAWRSGGYINHDNGGGYRRSSGKIIKAFANRVLISPAQNQETTNRDLGEKMIGKWNNQESIRKV